MRGNHIKIELDEKARDELEKFVSWKTQYEIVFAVI